MSRIERARTFAWRLLLAAAGWWVLNEGRSISAAFGAIVIVTAVLCGVGVSDARPARWRLRGLLELAGVFLVGSVQGAIDVARRAFAPAMPIEPGMLAYELRRPPGAGSHIFTSALSMAPGSLAITEHRSRIAIHVLVRNDTARKLAARLERSIDHAVREETRNA